MDGLGQQIFGLVLDGSNDTSTFDGPDDTNAMISLGARIFCGAESDIYKIAKNSTFLYKRYKPYRLTTALQEKLEYMMSNYPILLPMTDICECLAWPIMVTKNEFGDINGYIMPRPKFNIKLNDVYERDYYPYMFSVVVACNLCFLTHQLHNNDIIIGDFNHSIIGVDDSTSKVAILGCDSFHLSGGLYPCCVCMDGYAAPELLKHLRQSSTQRYASAPLPTFTQNTDLFSLATHIFRLLMNGISPYNGIQKILLESPNIDDDKISDVVSAGNEPIERGMYAFREGLTPAHPACPPQHILTDELIELFDRAFIGGGQLPRPRAFEWYKALIAYQSSLTICHNNKTHQYYEKLSCCPWCEAEQRETIFNNTRSYNNLPTYKVKRK